MTNKAKKRGLPKGAHRVRIEVAHDRALGTWFVRIAGGWRLRSGAAGLALGKAEALHAAVTLAREIASTGGFASVRIHDKRGKFQSERTYPRSSDPMPPRG